MAKDERPADIDPDAEAARAAAEDAAREAHDSAEGIQAAPLGDPPDRGDQVEVSIVFPNPSAKDRERLVEIRELLGQMGIEFDSSVAHEDSGVVEVQWSWDWSLQGPVRVEYVRRPEPDEA